MSRRGFCIGAARHPNSKSFPALAHPDLEAVDLTGPYPLDGPRSTFSDNGPTFPHNDDTLSDVEEAAKTLLNLRPAGGWSVPTAAWKDCQENKAPAQTVNPHKRSHSKVSINNALQEQVRLNLSNASYAEETLVDDCSLRVVDMNIESTSPVAKASQSPNSSWAAVKTPVTFANGKRYCVTENRRAPAADYAAEILKAELRRTPVLGCAWG